MLAQRARMRKTVRVRQVPSIPFLVQLVNWIIYEQFIVHIYLKFYVMFGFCKLLSISLTFYGEGLWQDFKFSCETTDNWTYFVCIFKFYWIDSSVTCWVSSYKDDWCTLKSLNTLLRILVVYVNNKSVYLFIQPSMFNESNVSDFSELLSKMSRFYFETYIFFS